MRLSTLAVSAFAVLSCLPLAGCGGAPSDAPPRVAGAAYTPDARPFDPDLDADAAVDAALARARATDKLVLVKMGGNWCPDCRVLSGMMEVDGIDALLDERFEVVKVDVGRPVADETGGGFAGYEKNRQVAERFGQGGFEGVPTLLIVTPEGELLNADQPSIFRNARDRDPQDLADYLYRYAAADAS